MPRLPLLAVTLALACRVATPEPHARPADAAAPFWQRPDGPVPEVPTCGETRRLDFELRPADVLLLFDRSESMLTEFGSGTRYSNVAEILGGLVEVYQDKLRFGFQQFPDVEACPEGYAAGCCAGPPSVPVGYGTSPVIRNAITAAGNLGGSTPTAEALRRAREYYAALDDGIAERYVLLSTDGRPSCDARGRLAEADVFDGEGKRRGGACYDALAEVDRLVAAGVKVIVLGVGSGLQDDPGGLPGCLEELAQRGGARRPEERPAFFSGADPQQLEISLQQIFAGTIRPSCLLDLKAEPPDRGQVAVFVDGHLVPRNRNYGWDYDSPDDPKRLRFFGEYCRRLGRFQIGAIEIRYGCPCPPGSTCE